MRSATDTTATLRCAQILVHRSNRQKACLPRQIHHSTLADNPAEPLGLIESVEEPYFYQVESCHYQFKDGDNFFIEAVFDPDKKEAAIKELKDHLDDLDYITEEELKKAKKRAMVNFAQDSETVCDIADTIGYYATVTEDISLASKYLATLEKIDCNYLEKIAQKYLNSNVVSVALLLPRGEK